MVIGKYEFFAGCRKITADYPGRTERKARALRENGNGPIMFPGHFFRPGGKPYKDPDRIAIQTKIQCQLD
jgi:hypothetical protein